MPTLPWSLRVFLVLSGAALAGCNATSHVNTAPRIDFGSVRQRELSSGSRRELEASVPRSADALSRMDAHRAALQNPAK